MTFARPISLPRFKSINFYRNWHFLNFGMLKILAMSVQSNGPSPIERLLTNAGLDAAIHA